MKKFKTAVDKFANIGDIVLSFTVEEFNEIQEIIDEQTEYNHPLKPVITKKQTELANHNQKMLNLVKEMKTLLEEAANIE